MTDLGTLPGDISSEATGINSAGQVVGESTSSRLQSPRATLWQASGVAVDLNTFLSAGSSWVLETASAINDSGQIVGSGQINGQSHAYRLTLPSGGGTAAIIDLGTLPGGTGSAATAISGNGLVVGTADVPNPSDPLGGTVGHAFLYSAGTMTDLGTLPGGFDSQAAGVNDAGAVVGIATVGGMSPQHAFLYSGGAMIDLGAGIASGINNSGQVVGSNGVTVHGFVYSGGTMTDVGTLPGGTFSSATAINATGQVAGLANSSQLIHAFRYSNGVMSDLGTLPGGEGSIASGINAGGDVVGFAWSSTTSADTTPPVSQLSIGSPKYPTGSSQPFVTAATPFSLAATDVDSAVQSVSYRIFPLGGAQPAYTTIAGTSASFMLTGIGGDGTYEIDYFADDPAGNRELVQTQLVRLDTTAPAITVTQPAATTYAHSAVLTLNYAVDDGSGSGVSNVTTMLDGLTTIAGHGLQSGQPINLLTELSLGSHTFTITATDNLGNASSRSVTFVVSVTAAGILADVSQFLAAGAIKNGGLANSLSVKLAAAASARSSGDCATAASLYHAFINELQAQSGKGVSPAAASTMIADAQYLIANCP
jgi:probable HAF family extracellular repeat protein